MIFSLNTLKKVRAQQNECVTLLLVEYRQKNENERCNECDLAGWGSDKGYIDSDFAFTRLTFYFGIFCELFARITDFDVNETIEMRFDTLMNETERKTKK